MNRSLKLVFLASIILNVLFVGVLAGLLPHGFDRSSSRQQRMENAIKTLPEPVQSRFRGEMEQTRKQVEPIRNQIEEARNETIRILTTEPFDEAAYERQVNKIQELRLQMGKQMSDNMKEVAKSLPPEQRKELAKILQRPPRN
jgi:uncharacterized membrane protein